MSYAPGFATNLPRFPRRRGVLEAAKVVGLDVETHREDGTAWELVVVPEWKGSPKAAPAPTWRIEHVGSAFDAFVKLPCCQSWTRLQHEIRIDGIPRGLTSGRPAAVACAACPDGFAQRVVLDGWRGLSGRVRAARRARRLAGLSGRSR